MADTSSCRKCGMHLRSKAVCVPGEGNRDAEIVILGEGLGEEEERLLRPFVGRAGWVLDKCLYEAGLLREEVFITNSVRCRPVTILQDHISRKNRTPTTVELDYCRGWLDDELAILSKKRVIVALGKSATWSALAPQEPTGGVLENEGKVSWSERYQCWVVLTIHPAYVLRKPAESFWLTLDLMMARGIVERGSPPESKPAEHTVIRTLDEAIAARDDILRNAQRLSLDWETDGVHLTRSQGFCVAFCASHRPDFAWVMPRYGSNFTPYWSRRDLRILDREVLVPLFTSDIPKIGHNLPFDMSITQSTVGCDVVNPDGDTMVLHHLINNHLGERAHGLKRLSVLYTSYGRYDDQLDRWLMENGYVKDGKPDGGYIYKAPNALVHPYNGTDSVVPMVVEPILNLKVQEADLWDVYREERLPFVFMYKDLDRGGVPINQPKLGEMIEDIETVAQRTDARLSQIAGYEINSNSHQQVAQYLYTDRGLPVLGYTETGQPSTKEEHLIQIAHLDPAIPLILNRRAYGKLKGTWLVGNKKNPGGLVLAVDEDGCARMNTITCAVETFRLATRRPFPIHTIPRPLVLWTCQREPKEENHGFYLFEKCCDQAENEVLSIRSLIVPDRGYKMVQGDFVQQEYCHGFGTRVLKSDATWHPIEELEVGDKLVGFEQPGRQKMHLIPSRVISKSVLFLPLFKVVTDAGEVTATADHKFIASALNYVRDGVGKSRRWIRVQDLRRGDVLQFYVSPWQTETSYDAGWFAGFLDGEGCVGGNTVGYGQKRGAVLQKALALTERYGIPYRVGRWSDGTGYGVTVRGCRQGLAVLGRFRPVRLLSKVQQLWNGRDVLCASSGPKNQRDTAKVLRIEPLGIRAVVALGTSTRTFIAEGFLSHNCIAAIASGQRDMEEAMLDRREDAHEFVMTTVGARSKFEFGDLGTEGKFVFRSDAAENEYKNLRSDWKRINFMILYRGGEKKLARSLTVRDHEHPERNRDVDPSEAASIIQQYYGRLPMIRQWQYNTIMELRRTGRVVGLFKTYRLLPGIWSPDKYDQFEAERQACNFPFQNGGYHVLARAMIKIYRAWQGKPPLKAPFPGRLLFSVHDEIVAQAREDLAQEAADQMQRLMEEPHDELVGACGIRRGIHADMKITSEWGGAGSRKEGYIDHGTRGARLEDAPAEAARLLREHLDSAHG